jgi:hypothetical protein
MKQYVIYRLDAESRKEIYVDQHQHLKNTLIEVTDELAGAKKFDSAREAYDWARMKNLDYWRVGAR